jgi:hypothetical protein
MSTWPPCATACNERLDAVYAQGTDRQLHCHEFAWWRHMAGRANECGGLKCAVTTTTAIMCLNLLCRRCTMSPQPCSLQLSHSAVMHAQDPFTGGGAYVPGGGASSRGPSSAAASQQVTGGGADPFTGGASAAAKPAAHLHMPAAVFVTFTNAPNTEAIARKVK